jgi:hypothetical protein
MAIDPSGRSLLNFEATEIPPAPAPKIITLKKSCDTLTSINFKISKIL